MAQNGEANGQQFDSHLYGGEKFSGYNTSIPLDEEDEENEPTMAPRCVHAAVLLCAVLLPAQAHASPACST
jgi:hypothetical protein